MLSARGRSKAPLGFKGKKKKKKGTEAPLRWREVEGTKPKEDERVPRMQCNVLPAPGGEDPS